MELLKHSVFGVSCDSCERDNFRGRRYKCLVCFDFDLCSRCYEAKFRNEFHRPDHPMQCILTRSDYDTFYGGEAVEPGETQAYACPLCADNGFTENTLQDHVTSHHGEHHAAVLCPICAATPNAELNRTLEDLATHIAEDHLRIEANNQEEQRNSRPVSHGVSRPGLGRTVRRGGRHLTGLSSFARDSVDPIAELLSQLGGIRRAGANLTSAVSQLPQIQQQVRQNANRRTILQIDQTGSSAAGTSVHLQVPSSAEKTATVEAAANVTEPPSCYFSISAEDQSKMLITKLLANAKAAREKSRSPADLMKRALFLRELLFSAINDGLPAALRRKKGDGDSSVLECEPQSTD